VGFRTLQAPSEVPLLFQPAISDPRPMPTPSMYVSTKLPDGIDRSYCRANVASSKSVERDVRLMYEIEAKLRGGNSPPETPKTVRSQGESAAETCIEGSKYDYGGSIGTRRGVKSYIDEVLLLQMAEWRSPRGRRMQKVKKRWTPRNGPECKRRERGRSSGVVVGSGGLFNTSPLSCCP